MENEQAKCNAYNLVDTWIERELRHVNFGDKRIVRRVIKIPHRKTKKKPLIKEKKGRESEDKEL